MTTKFTSISHFLLQLDGLKSIERRTYINGGERLENSAEHSWHLAMACWAFAELLPANYDLKKLMQLALVHDLGEIGAGDTFLYSNARSDAHIKERAYIDQLASHSGNPIAQLADIWQEQEDGESKEAKLLKVVDRLLPFLHNLQSQGKTWQENNIKKHQVVAMHQFIEADFPQIYQWFCIKLEEAVDQGWLPVE